MKTKIIFVAHAITNPNEDIAKVLRILMSLQGNNIIAVAPYLNSHMYGDWTKNTSQSIENAQEISKRYILDNFCDEMWLYGNSMDNHMLELVALTKKIGRVPILPKTPEMKLLLEELARKFPE